MTDQSRTVTVEARTIEQEPQVVTVEVRTVREQIDIPYQVRTVRQDQIPTN